MRTIFGPLLAVALLGAGLAACGAGANANESRRLPGCVGSLEELGESVLAALAAHDTVRLQGFRLTESEHNRIVWPELPASRSDFPVDLAWRNIQVRNQAALSRRLAQFGGRSLEFEEAACDGPTDAFESFEVHTDCRVTFRADGEWVRAQLFKHVLTMDGEHKVFRYYE